MIDEHSKFGLILRKGRESAGLSRETLAQRVGLNSSYIYRLETGSRKPSRDTALALAEILNVNGEALNQWLLAAGFAPVPLLSIVRGAVRTRGGGHHQSLPRKSPEREAARWANWLEAIGLQEIVIGRLLQAMEVTGLTEQQRTARTISNAFSLVVDALESPVRTAVIPAAKENPLIAPYVMQRMLLRVISEATNSGITRIILILSPGMIEPFYAPLKEMLNLLVIPSITLQYCIQQRPEGLGDAILQAEELIVDEPFAVLLPDDVVYEKVDRSAVRTSDLRGMLELFTRSPGDNFVAVTSVPRSKLPQYGVALIREKRVSDRGLPIIQLIEKPPTDSISHSNRALGIVGRYLLQSTIFEPLRRLQQGSTRPLQLTSALELLRQAGQSIYAFELTGTRQDIGEVFMRASDLFNASSNDTSIAES